MLKDINQLESMDNKDDRYSMMEESTENPENGPSHAESRSDPLNEIEKTLAEGVRRFWKGKQFTDVDIHCGKDGGVIQAHCLVLASISPILKSALKSANLESLVIRQKRYLYYM